MNTKSQEYGCEECHDCGNAMLPAEFQNGVDVYPAGEVVDGAIWIRCVGCGCRAGWREVEQQN